MDRGPEKEGDIAAPESPAPLIVGNSPPGGRRADAVKNRDRVLCAAREVIRTSGADGLTMDAVARIAGVGKGTVFRHFGDRAGLIHALMDTGERRFQESFLIGPPPLGPGAPPDARIHAFGAALIAHRRANLELMQEFGNHLGHPVYRGWHTHLRHLLTGTDSVLDPDVAAHMLLAATDPPLLANLTAEAADTRWAELERTWAAMADGIIGAR